MNQIIFIFLLLGYSLSTTIVVPVPGLDDLGSSFDIVRGTSMNKHAIKYSEHTTIYDYPFGGSWSVPDEVTLNFETEALLDSSNNCFTDTKSISDSYVVSTGVSGEYAGVAFSLSAEIGNAKNYFHSSSGMIVEVKELFGFYHLSLDPPIELAVDSKMQILLDNLPNTYDYNIYEDYFIKNYGTHYIRNAYFGGSLSQQYLVNSQYSSTTQSNYIKIQAQTSYMNWKVSAGMSYSHSTVDTEFTKSITFDNHVLGGNPEFIEMNKYNDWVTSIKLLPTMIKYELEEILSILPEGTKKTNLKKAFQHYYEINNLTNSQESCKFCQSCGGQFTEKVGGKLNQGDWGAWYSNGQACGADYVSKMDQFDLCCTKSRPCSFCSSCGDEYPYEVGRKLNQYDWGPWSVKGASCTGFILFKSLNFKFFR